MLASTADDYGTSYYFRGNVANNYVVFANMCWRIVRITGNGAIKLVLYNYNPGSVSNPCDTSQNGDTYAFARYSGSIYTTAFNINSLVYSYNAGMGFMYGTYNSNSYATEHANTNKSTILSNLESWYTAKLSSYAGQLADTIWCNDKSTSGSGYKNYNSVYGPSIRTNNPSLICPNDNDGGKLSKFTADETTYGNGALTYKIGLLTADEIIYAGMMWSTGTVNSYLVGNTAGYSWWTLSPATYQTAWEGSIIVRVYNLSQFVNQNLANVLQALRPAIALLPTIGVNPAGTGTSANPYVILP